MTDRGTHNSFDLLDYTLSMEQGCLFRDTQLPATKTTGNNDAEFVFISTEKKTRCEELKTHKHAI